MIFIYNIKYSNTTFQNIIPNKEKYFKCSNLRDQMSINISNIQNNQNGILSSAGAFETILDYYPRHLHPVLDRHTDLIESFPFFSSITPLTLRWLRNPSHFAVGFLPKIFYKQQPPRKQLFSCFCHCHSNHTQHGHLPWDSCSSHP